MEEEAPKPTNVVRGKDGHVKLGGAGDFFSDPMAAPSGRGPTGGCVLCAEQITGLYIGLGLDNFLDPMAMLPGRTSLALWYLRLTSRAGL